MVKIHEPPAFVGMEGLVAYLAEFQLDSVKVVRVVEFGCLLPARGC